MGKLGPEARKAIPDLLSILNEPGEDVQEAANEALNLIIPQTAKQPIESLKSSDPSERAFAAAFLARTDQLPKNGIQPLVEALSDRDSIVRFFAAEALLRTDVQQAILVPPLRDAIYSSDKNIRAAAAQALSLIAERLQKDSKKLTTVELNRAISELKGVIRAMETATSDQEDAVVRVRKSLNYLEADQRQLLGPLIALWILEHQWISLPVFYILFFLFLWTMLLWLRPIWLHRIAESLRPLPEFSLPAQFGGVKISVYPLLLLVFFNIATAC